MLPDLEQIVVAHLRATSAVTALTSNVGTRTPPSTDLPWVKASLIHAQPDPSSPALHFASVLVQLDCYGGANRELAQGQASTLARTVQAALNDMPGSHTGAVVTAVKTSGPRRIPDVDMKPARERYIVTADVSTHPA